MYLFILIFFSTVSYALYEVFAAKAGIGLDANLSAALINGIGTILPLLFFVFLRLNHSAQPVSRDGIIYSILAGLAIATFSVLILKVFAQGGTLSYVIPAIYGGAILLSAIVGIFLWKESISLLQGIGLIATIIGIGIIVVSKM